jgi:phosphatidylserine/phosphatidylglycerophosphate/cardiolipin synthase-like enzyme
MATHHKVLIIDGEVVITGSYNFNKSARMRYDQNTLILHSPEIGVSYLDEFERVLTLAAG